MSRIEIDKDEPLNPGDRIVMEFKYLGPGWLYLRSAELAFLEWTLEQKNPYWQSESCQSLDDRLLLEFLIKEPPADQMAPIQKAGFVTPAIIGAIVLGAGLFTWLSLDKIEKITESPAGTIALAGSGFLGIGIAIIAVVLLLSWRK